MSVELSGKQKVRVVFKKHNWVVESCLLLSLKTKPGSPA